MPDWIDITLMAVTVITYIANIFLHDKIKR